MENFDQRYIGKRGKPTKSGKKSLDKGATHKRKSKNELDIGSKWSTQEDEKLSELVGLYGDKNWA